MHIHSELHPLEMHVQKTGCYKTLQISHWKYGVHQLALVSLIVLGSPIVKSESQCSCH